MCAYLQAKTFEAVHTETSFLVCLFILTISMSRASIKVTGSMSRSYVGKIQCYYLGITLTWFYLFCSRPFQGQIVSVWLCIGKTERHSCCVCFYKESREGTFVDCDKRMHRYVVSAWQVSKPITK